MQARDVGVEELGAPLVGQRDAMVAVGDEVEPAQLVDLDRRHVAIRKRRTQSREPRARQRALQLEVATKIAASVYRSDDPLQRHGTHTHVGLADDLQPTLHLVKWQESHVEQDPTRSRLRNSTARSRGTGASPRRFSSQDPYGPRA